MKFILVALLVHFGVTSSERLIDLSFSYEQKAPLNYPGSLPFRFLSQFAGTDPNGIWYSSNDFETGEHSGTHLDAPYHFCKTSRTVEQIPIEELFATGVLINATLETADNWNYSLPVSKLQEWEENYGELPSNSVILVSFGWAKRYPNRKLVYGPSDDDLRFPGISSEAADWIVKTKKVVGVGVDTPSVDSSKSTTFPAHTKFACNEMYMLENVALLEELPPSFPLYVFPMKIAKGTGAPARVVAQC